MPIIVQSYRCASCAKLIATTEPHTVIDEFKAHKVLKEGAKTWDADHAGATGVTDRVVCNDDCLQDFVIKELQTKR